MSALPLPIALTQGDPSGIGPDLTLSAWMRRTGETVPFYVVADPTLLAKRAELLGLDVEIVETTPADAAGLFSSRLPVVPLSRRVSGSPGQPCVEDAAGTIEAIETAVQHVRSGLAAAVVTNPIAKSVLYASGFAHPGHTEFLGELAARFWNMPRPLAVMMIWSDMLAVVPVTIHIALAEVQAGLSRSLIEATARIVDHDCRLRFGIGKPRLACAGLNPHAGEGGSMGRDEIDMIIPALEALRASGIDITGPFPADTLFTSAARPGYDVALAMFHDQALIPIKTLAFDEAVNVTLGLPFIRTSPDHGTAFDIAGRGIARDTSLVAALALAGRLAVQERAGLSPGSLV
ncbi:4-hydroxythreonine-4-phosphate dehydrogenase PdxA [Lichenihabitans psoromatis]|uniref:4-hydroxythreonine-4-phosphate dehydrogenase PdxA n=1 Tax=Lichenihabitans psoromatis TaxID=2528642 RepID=UPI0010385DCB|nr:4-hydroxythreonine-4-phosphate dehydrogenase PdxA [Lichenihabitans psoromatis]